MLRGIVLCGGLVCAGLLGGSVAVAAEGNAMPSAALKLVTRSAPLIIAHRGNSSAAPENTLPAFQQAVKLKADLVELDYHTTADGELLVIHDKTLDRTTDAVKRWGGSKLAVASFPLGKLQTLDAGAWFDAKYAGTKLPTLAESLDVIQAGSVTLIEHKAGEAAALVKLLRAKDLVDTVVVQSFDWKFLADCHRLEPRLVLGALGDKELTAARLDQISATGAKVVGWNHKFITPREIKLIQARGYKAWVYTVDDDARAKALLAGGLDGLITNRPGPMSALRKSVAAE